jgi:iron(III) transport system ATP-binding protein
MSEVRLERVSHRFAGSTTAPAAAAAVDDLSLDVRSGELLALLGPSGCGKTTTLRIVAGFVRPDAGRVWFDGRDATSLPPEQRGIGMVFQSYALFPHLDVFENVAFGLRTRRVRASEMVERVRRALEVVGLAGSGARTVQSLSGGQQQRVALARAIVVEPRILLLDEPLSNLDARLREETRAEIRRIQRQLGITALYVTHDREEALAISDRIAVLRRGRLEQIDTPPRIFAHPATAFVAAFVGGANLVPGRVESVAGGRPRVAIGGGGSLEGVAASGAVSVGGPATAAIRPSSLRLGSGDANRLFGRVTRVEYRGDAARLWLELEPSKLRLEAALPSREDARIPEGESIALGVLPEDVLIYPGDGTTT